MKKLKSNVFFVISVLFFLYILYKLTGFVVEKVLMNIFPDYIVALNIISIFLIFIVLLPFSIMMSYYLSDKLHK